MAQNVTGNAGFIGAPITSAFGMTSNVDCIPGRAIQISATGAGTVHLTFADGSLLDVNVAIGDNIYPYAIKKYTAGTATGLTVSALG